MKQERALRFFISFTGIGLAHWFFGNLYETVVFTPNTLADPATALTHWNAFTRVSTPVWYYIPMSPLTFLASVAACVLGRHRGVVLRQWLLRTLVLTTLATALTVYIVTQINVNVFFSGMNLITHRDQVNTMIWTGIPLGLTRLVATGIGLYSAIRSYLHLLLAIKPTTSIH